MKKVLIANCGNVTVRNIRSCREENIKTVDAMKMENEIISPISGTVDKIMTKIGSSVDKDKILLTIERDK